MRLVTVIHYIVIIDIGTDGVGSRGDIWTNYSNSSSSSNIHVWYSEHVQV